MTMWAELAPVDRDARVQLHWAAQVLAAAADAWIAPRADDRHTALALVEGALVGEAGVALRLAPFALELGGAARLPLRGRTLAEAMAWADAQLAAAAGTAPRGIHARAYDMPAHPVGTDGAAFTATDDALAGVGRWYEAGAAVLAAHASLRVWPHHFDLGGIVYLGAVDPKAPQLGVGLSPGDGSYAEPYVYVTPYPAPPGTVFPPLPAGGAWATAFTGAVLTATALLTGAPNTRDTRGTREARARQFVASAIAAGRAISAPV